MSDGVVFDYLNPDVPKGLKTLDVPLIRANRESIKGYGEIVRDPKKHRIEIVPWPLGDLEGAIDACEDSKSLIGLMALARKLHR